MYPTKSNAAANSEPFKYTRLGLADTIEPVVELEPVVPKGDEEVDVEPDSELVVELTAGPEELSKVVVVVTAEVVEDVVE